MLKEPDVLGEIAWPKEPVLTNTKMWERNVKMVKMLCGICKVIRWQNGEEGEDTYVHMPHHYEIAGLRVEFLPIWNFYQIGGYSFDVRDTAEDIQLDIAAVKASEAVRIRGGRFARN